MRILTRYILKEVGSHALLGVGLFTFIIFMRDLGRLLELIVRNSAPVPSVGEIFLYTLPTTFTLTLPMGVLVGILVGLSRLAADSEVTAIRASGMGVGMFVRAIAIFAIGAWMLGMVNNIYVAPRSAIALNELQHQLKSSQASFEIQPHVFYEEFKNVVLYVQDSIPVHGRSLWQGIFLADVSDPSSPKVTLAKRGALLSDSPDKLRLHLEDGTQQENVPKAKDQYSITTFDSTEIPIQLPRTAERAHELLPVAELGLRDLLRNARADRRAAVPFKDTDPGDLELRPDQSALLRDRIPSQICASGGVPGAGDGRHPAGTIGPQGRQEYRLRAHHPAGVRVLLLLADRRFSGASGEDASVGRRLDGQHLLLPLRTGAVMARGSHAD